MAASVERNLRLKVSIHSNGINQTVPRQLWYSVSQSPNSHITDVKKDLLTKLGTGLNLKALLSMEGFVIPDWETTQIFRDGDHIILETNGIENQEDVEEVYERKRLRKRQRSSPSDKSPVKNGDMSEEPKPKKKKKSKHKDKESELLGMTAPPPSIATPAPRKVGETKKNEKTILDVSSSDDSEVEAEIPRSKARDRSIALTPAEQKLIDEINSLPKPKRKRKHKRGKKEKNTIKDAVEKIESGQTASLIPTEIVLKCDFAGVKKVFTESDHERDEMAAVDNGFHPIEAQMETPIRLESRSEVTSAYTTPLLGQSPQMNVDDHSFSEIDVKPKITSIPVYRSTPEGTDGFSPQLTPHTLPVTISSNLPTPSPVAHDTFTQPKLPKNNKSKKGGPMVYKRVKPKLRATISPAILAELQKAESSSPQTIPVGWMKTADTSEHSPEEMQGAHETTPANRGTRRQRPPRSKTASFHDDELQNISQVYENSPVFTSLNGTHTPDEPTDSTRYEQYPSLTRSPEIGDKLAFKVLEINDDYTPVVSAFKQGIVMQFEPQSRLVKVKVLKTAVVGQKRRAGKFSVNIEDETEVITNEEESDEIVTKLSSLMDIRLMS